MRFVFNSTAFYLFGLLLLTSCSPFGNVSTINLLSLNSIIGNRGGSSLTISNLTISNSLMKTPIANWAAESGSENVVKNYQVCLGSVAGQCDVEDWINVGLATSYQFSSKLKFASSYFISLRYVDKNTNLPGLVYSGPGFTTPLDGAAQISVSWGHSCALSYLGNVKCWGYNGKGQLGYDDVTNRGGTALSMSSLANIDLGINRTAKKISVGDEHTCVILDDGNVKCWGENYDGRLGYEDRVVRGNAPGSMAGLPNINLGIGKTAVEISAGTSSTCVILNDGDAKCWGVNYLSVLGYDDNLDRGASVGSMASLGSINLGVGKTAKKISISRDHTCAILNDDTVKCWGYNWAGQLGYDDTNPRGHVAGSMSTLASVNLGAGRTAKQISVVQSTTCALLDDNNLKCWGVAPVGQISTQNGDVAGSMAALQNVDLGTGRTAKMVQSGDDSICVILDNNQIKCWGYSTHGTGYNSDVQLGYAPGSLAALSEIELGIDRSALEIANGSFQFCTILDTAEIKCWGLNSYGQLGYGDFANRGNSAASMAELPTVNLGTGQFAKQISAGAWHTCALLLDDSVKCWGYNNAGNLGYDDNLARGGFSGSMSSLNSINFGIGKTVKQISSAVSNNCAIFEDDNVKCWGNRWGGIGYDSNIGYGSSFGDMLSLPNINLGPGRTAKKISTSAQHTCVILDDDTVKCWGDNSYGQLGYDDLAQRGNTFGSMATLSTVNLGFGNTAKQIATSQYHTCVILQDDSVKCWGRNWSGELGYFSGTNQGGFFGSMAALPTVDLGPGRTAKQITAGSSSTCVILDDNNVRCWGYSIALGQDTYSAFENTNLGLGKTAKKISAGWDAACAILNDDSVKCWGSQNNWGLGTDGSVGITTGTALSLLSPVNLGLGRTAKDISMGLGHTCAVLDNNSVKCWGSNGSGQLGHDDILPKGVGYTMSDPTNHKYRP